MDLIPAPSPNFDVRRAPPDMVVLHYTGMPTGAEALARLCDPAAKVVRPLPGRGGWARVQPSWRRRGGPGMRGFRSGRASGTSTPSPSGWSSSIRVMSWAIVAFPDAQIDALIALLDEVRGALDHSRRTHPRPFRRGAGAQGPIRASGFPGSVWPRPATDFGSNRPPRPDAALSLGDDGTGRVRPAGGPDAAGLRQRAVGPVRRSHRRHHHRLPAPLASRTRGTASPTERPARGWCICCGARRLDQDAREAHLPRRIRRPGGRSSSLGRGGGKSGLHGDKAAGNARRGRPQG